MVLSMNFDNYRSTLTRKKIKVKIKTGKNEVQIKGRGRDGPVVIPKRHNGSSSEGLCHWERRTREGNGEVRIPAITERQ